MKKDLAIFDLDGTLYDTGDVNYFSYKNALMQFGKELDREYYVTQCNGRHYTEFLPSVMGKDGADENIEAVHDSKKKLYFENLFRARENIHLFNLIELMREKYNLAVVTTASRKNTMDILKYFNRDKFFDLIITQEDISKVKPDPEGFLIAMKHFNTDPEHTLIFEDSEVGIKAARAAGAGVFVVDRF